MARRFWYSNWFRRRFRPAVNDVQVPNALKIADHNLEPMHQDELIIGYEQEYNEDWTLGVKFMGRTVRDGMDDTCSKDGFTRWAADNGYDNFDPHSLQGCIIVNPGSDLTFSLDLNNDGNLTKTTVPAEYFGLPEYKRHYLGLEFTADKEFSDNWKGGFSYVLSRTFGNVEGYVNSSLAQEDPGATQDFDHENFMHGAYGNLPTDRTHQFKFNGLYRFSDEVDMSINFSAVSGIPLSCQGFVSLDGMLQDPSGNSSTDYDYHNFFRYSASSFYCRNQDGEQELTQRGDGGRSNWLINTDMSVIYKPEWSEGLTLQATVFNVFNTQRPNAYDQVKDLNKGAAGINPNYQSATSYQDGRTVTLIARYAF